MNRNGGFWDPKRENDKNIRYIHLHPEIMDTKTGVKNDELFMNYCRITVKIMNISDFEVNFARFRVFFLPGKHRKGVLPCDFASEDLI